MLLPRILRPLPADLAGEQADLDFAPAPIALLRPRRGAYSAESLAAVIEHAGRWKSSVWLREAEPGPAPLAEALTDSCRHRWPAAGSVGESRPDPVAALVGVLRGAPQHAVVVVELAGAPTAGTHDLLDALRPVLADRSATLIVVAERRLPVRWSARSRGGHPAARWGELPEPCHADVPARLPSLLRHRSAVIRDVADAARLWPADTVVEAVQSAHGRRDLLRRLTTELLRLCTPAQRAALETCVRLGYWHPQLGAEAVPVARLRPWVLPLEDGWGCLRPDWRRPLQRALDRTAGPTKRAAVATAAVAGRRPPDPERAPGAPSLEVRLLGAFELRIDGRAVRNWNGQRGIHVMRYLLARRRYACSRDELLEEFWPDVAPGVARNRLQVAVSGLRRTLATVTPMQVVEFVDGEYRVNPKFHVVVDVERFERALARARKAERAADPDAALAGLREAVDLYRGDFVPDAPYGQWTLLPRESLRLAYVDALDRISRIHIARGEIDQCVATALRMLDVDPSWEPAHRILIRCYADQGRTYLALRQYELCRRVLQQTLDTDPQPETVQLFMSVRTGRRAEHVLTD